MINFNYYHRLEKKLNSLNHKCTVCVVTEHVSLLG